MDFIGMKKFQIVQMIVVLPVYILLPKIALQEFVENVIIAVNLLNAMIGWIINVLNVIQRNSDSKIQHLQVPIFNVTV